MTFENIKLEESKKRANYIKELFAQNKLKLNELSHLGKLLKTVENSEKGKSLELFDILDISRVYEALVVFETIGIEETILNRIRKGKLDFNNSSNDDGKNILFELEIAASFLKKGISVKFDEPDLIVELLGKKIGIACKKINSIKRIQQALSKGTKQNIEQKVDYAIVALNIDNYHPIGHLLVKRTRKDALDFIHKRNKNLYFEQKKEFNKYLNDGRLQSVFIDSRIKTDITDEAPRFNNLTMTTVIQSEKDELINQKIKEIFSDS
ncbi:hypothetical protein Abu_1328 [Aliarcobacter butzleri RM4018]|uniref:Uncharacterized protein n=1 Tax=Aliarcobacter butzleri (strain RM4018) TaxID=367737 RepID=A8EUG0_ALIB4|nr:hypothetical protein [Aliarcobacter butzleri]ABV67584.1 hypothetical protein Abu_1328 [Aliarcobacter butzleri RM4018]GGT74701.1 hypothetical protein GCM10007985_08260 [Aliarcobacter butzleri]SNV29411.1 Uncharacterised protein [Aliarcobacter butzleri]